MDALKAFALDNILWFLLIPTSIGLFALLKHYFPNMKDDGPVEEAIEEVIKEKTGLDIDLTPGSPTTQK